MQTFQTRQKNKISADLLCLNYNVTQLPCRLSAPLDERQLKKRGEKHTTKLLPQDTSLIVWQNTLNQSLGVCRHCQFVIIFGIACIWYDQNCFFVSPYASQFPPIAGRHSKSLFVLVVNDDFRNLHKPFSTLVQLITQLLLVDRAQGYDPEH